MRVKQDAHYREGMSKAFRQALIRKGQNLTEFKEQVNASGWKVSYATLNRWYRGERAPEGKDVERLVEALGDEGRRLLVNTLAAEITVTRGQRQRSARGGKAYVVGIEVRGQGWLTG